MVIREYEMSTEENFFKTGTLRIGLNNSSMDVKYYLNKNGFHVADLKRPATVSVPATVPIASIPIVIPSVVPIPPPIQSVPVPLAARSIPGLSRQVINQQRSNQPAASPRLLTGERLANQ